MKTKYTISELKLKIELKDNEFKNIKEQINQIQKNLNNISAEKLLADDKITIKNQNKYLRIWRKLETEKKRVYSQKVYWSKLLAKSIKTSCIAKNKKE